MRLWCPSALQHPGEEGRSLPPTWALVGRALLGKGRVCPFPQASASSGAAMGPAGPPWDQPLGQTGVPGRQAAENRPWECLNVPQSARPGGRAGRLEPEEGATPVSPGSAVVCWSWSTC